MRTKMKINKACDVNSISVLPPHTREIIWLRSSRLCNTKNAEKGIQSKGDKTLDHVTASLITSLASVFSWTFILPCYVVSCRKIHLRLCSQERENSVNRSSCFLPLTYGREGSQQPNSRSSTNPMQRWNSADHRSLG
ncbi:hypothetical protein L6164_003895 [Bauhinia variegata]|uniref:Uncharacterized protein n=1 Tax=Bauhinia variegata TaxID=167791 RepID=A0ACB9Q486_BAUVA|nr:hypothetical protein L6164_003895 [Bauhinia variegata]